MKANQQKTFGVIPLYWISLSVIVSMLVLQGCCFIFPSKCHRPVVVLKNRIKAPQAIAFIDVNDAIPKNVHNVKVTLIDPEKMMLSSNGISFETVELMEGVMSVGLSTNAQFSNERPYRFSVRAEAKGYMTTVRSIVITDATPNYTPIYMAKLDSLPPSGLAASVGNVTAVSGGTVTEDQTLSAMLPQGSRDSFQIKIPGGTQLFYGKEPVKTEGPLSYRILFGKSRDSNANRAFPGGFEVTDAINENGESIADAAKPIFFTTAGWFSMEMNIGKTIVNGFSKPLEVEIPIADTVINPTTQRVVKVGDTIPIWSLNTQTGTWTRESDAKITSSVNGGLNAKIKITHLSTVNFDYWTGGCTNPISVDFRPIDFSSPSFDHLIEYINTADGSTLKYKVANLATAPLQVFRAPAGIIGKLKVHQTEDQASSVIGESTPLTCTSTGTCADAVPGNCLSTFGSPSPSTTLRFRITNAAGSVIGNLCTNYVWLKTADLYYAFEGILNSGVVIIQQQPTGTGKKDVILWYIQDPPGPAPPVSISLRVNINFDTDDDVKVYIGNSPTAAGTGTSTKTPPAGAATEILIDIPESIIPGCT